MSPFESLYRIYDALTGPPSEAILLLQVQAVVLLWWVLLGIAFTGIGVGLRRLCGLRPSRGWDWLLAFWVGWAVMLAALQLWHLVFPVGGVVFWIVFALGVGGWVLVWRDALVMLRHLADAWFFVLLYALAGFLIANSAIGPPSLGDYGLYHQQAIIWAGEYSVVPGLGNIHGRLAFNNSVFLYAAMVDALSDAGSHIAASTLIMATGAIGLWGVRRVWRGDLSVMGITAALITLIPAWAISNNDHVRTPDSDLPVVLMGMVIMLLLVWLSRRGIERREVNYSLGVLILLAAASVTLKLSAVGFAAAVVVAAVLIVWRTTDVGFPVRPVLLGGAGVTLLAVGWAARGIIMSGYLAYPNTTLGFDVDWRVACEQAAIEAENVVRWARIPAAPVEEVIGTWSWIPRWAVRTLRWDAQVFTPLLMIAFTAALRLRWRGPYSREWGLLAVPVVGLVFWFFSAPDPRFLGASLWALAFVGLATALAEHARDMPSVVKTGLLVGIVLLTYDYTDAFLTFAPAPETGFHPAPTVEVTPTQSESGLVVYVPADGGQQCFGASIPCAPSARELVSARVVGELGAGFRVPQPGTCG